MLSPKTAKSRRSLVTCFSLMVLLLLAAVVFQPEWFAQLSSWLNLYDARNERLLDWARAFNLIMVFMTTWNLLKVLLRFPHRKRFVLMLLPLLGMSLYFLSQFLAPIDMYPRNGFIVINILSGLALAGYSVTLGVLHRGDLEGG